MILNLNLWFYSYINLYFIILGYNFILIITPDIISLEVLLVDWVSQSTAPLMGERYNMSPCFNPTP
jgi:hypothetical protein